MYVKNIYVHINLKANLLHLHLNILNIFTINHILSLPRFCVVVNKIDEASCWGPADVTVAQRLEIDAVQVWDLDLDPVGVVF